MTENSLFPISVPKLSIAAARKYCPVYGCNQMLGLQLRYRVDLLFCKFIVSFHHTMAIKHCLEDDETERQLKCKVCDVELHSQVLRGVSYKGEVQLNEERE
jgi:hypothetical protein